MQNESLFRIEKYLLSLLKHRM